MNPYVESAGGGVSGDGGGSESESGGGVSYAAVAARLLQDNFLLTALELHTELVESGRELPQLREFFSNPGNFEQHVSRPDPAMHRTPSQATLDSLDLARYSEDGGTGAAGAGTGGSEVAVLEFELRKARETINSLRANLTQFADCDASDSTRDRLDRETLKPHEKRALNFLVNEYLLLQQYKLTAITFSDENPDQDFEDWDDVGLNVPRPCGLISLYRGEPAPPLVTAAPADATTVVDAVTADALCQTDSLDESMCVSCQTSFEEDTDWNHEILIQAEEIVLLKQQVLALETDKLNFQKLYDAALASLNSLTTPVAESPGVELSMPQERLASMRKESSLERICSQPLAYAENHYGSNASTSSVTPELFEMIDCEKNGGRGWSETARAQAEGARDSPRRASVATLDDTLSINEAGEWTRVHHPYNTAGCSDTWIGSSLPGELKASLLSWCCGAVDTSVGSGHDLLAELAALDKPITPQGLVPLAADTLLRIVPHTLVSRRCEAVALLAATAHLLAAPCPDSAPAAAPAARRARLLQLLLTLLKKPDPAEAKIITEAVCLVVRWGGGGEVLSCVAELLASRSSERRALAAHVCLAVAPHLSLDLCTSLLLSLVVLMCEANEPEIRQLGLKAAILLCPVAEHKYGQLESIFFAMLKDPVEQIRHNCVCVFAPVLSRSALGAGKLSTDLCHRVMAQLVKSSSEGSWKNIALYLDIVRALAPAVLAHVINVQIVKDKVHGGSDEQSTSYREISLHNNTEFFLDLQCYLTDYNLEPKLLIDSMNRVVKETPDVRWPELDWFLEKIIKQLLEIAVNCKTLNHATTYHSFITIFSTYCEMFGEVFSSVMLKPTLLVMVAELERRLERLEPVNTESAVVAGILLAAVMPLSENSESDIASFLKKWVVCSGVCSLPVEVMAEPLKWLATHAPQVLTHCLQCLREIVGSGSGVVREYVAVLLSELASCADVPGASVDAHLLPAVIALLHDEDSGVRERAVTALGSVTRASETRGLACAARCWDALEAVVEGAGDAGAGAGEAARAADALAVLLAPDVEAATANADLSLKVLALLCRASQRAPLTGDVLSSLIPGLQLAVHFAQPHRTFVHSTLLPALRRLEKIDSPSLVQHKQAVETLLASVAGAEAAPAPRPSAPHILAGTEAVGRRVTQIFQQSKTNMNIPNIFKKKS